VYFVTFNRYDNALTSSANLNTLSWSDEGELGLQHRIHRTLHGCTWFGPGWPTTPDLEPAESLCRHPLNERVPFANINLNALTTRWQER
jgi:hypothetical protein